MVGHRRYERKDAIRNEVQYRAGKIAKLESDGKADNTDQIIQHFDAITELFAEYLNLGFPKALLLEGYNNSKQINLNRQKLDHNQSNTVEMKRLKALERKYEILVQYLTNAPEPDPELPDNQTS
ncbi:hypothetical protein L0663_05270 [Dyadobacter sp. CY107]|uniref:hypothetical protein n=1 Tax=Dyadobacter fanqingshengii TaxID=2906443 RepID=UPI001F272381|nr:hypothetical protein [Dyadobacter fanqingshengii]MCF2502778.1 hypothetical protein [Dyadobacter fanqingshengii]